MSIRLPGVGSRDDDEPWTDPWEAMVQLAAEAERQEHMGRTTFSDRPIRKSVAGRTIPNAASHGRQFFQSAA